MEPIQNPYAPPSSNLTNHGAYSSTAELGVTARVVDLLARTKGWVRFIGVMSFIGAAFMILGTFGMLAMRRNVGDMVFILVSIYGLMSAFYVYAGVKLNSYANAIGRLIFSGKVFDLEQALDQQRAFWKFAGIMVIVGIALMLLAMVSGAMAASAASRF